MPHVFIIGATSDIAKALSFTYAKAGYDLYLAGRNTEEIRKNAKDVSIRFGVKAEAVFIDILKPKEHQEIYYSLSPKPEGVICLAGYLGNNDKAKTDLDEARAIIDTNFTGCVSILNVCAEDFENRKKGFIIGISSVAGDRGRQSNYFYGSAKAGFTAYLSGLRNRLSGSNVHVMTVKPGFVNTKMTEGLDIPPLLTSEPDKVASDIFKAQKKGKDIIYTAWFWKWIMMIIKHIPEGIFKKLKM